MKKRNMLLISIATVAVGTGIAFAGAKGCYDGSEHHKGRFGDHRMETIVDKMDRHLDLSEQQQVMIKDILETKKPIFAKAGKSHAPLHWQILKLDPASANFDQSVDKLADEIANQVRSHAVEMADAVKQISAVLTPAQAGKAREMIENTVQHWDNHRHEKGDA